MNYRHIFVVFSLLVLIGAGCSAPQTEEDSTQMNDEIDRDAILLEAKENGLIMDAEEIALMRDAEIIEDSQKRTVYDIETYLNQNTSGWASAALADVTGGESFGTALAQFDAGTYTLIAKMGNLPEPAGDYSYAVWLVRRGDDLSVLYAGEAVKTEQGFAHAYVSSADLSEYDFFVLTLQQKSDTLIPEEHILEGTLK